MLQPLDECAVKLPSATILYPGLRSLIRNRLQQTIQLRISPFCNEQFEIEHPLLSTPLSLLQPEAIPLSPIKDGVRIGYGSAIALKFAGQYGGSAMDLAQQIAIGFSSPRPLEEELAPPLLQTWQHFALKVMPPGWIDIELTDQGIALGLQELVTQRLNSGIRQFFDQDPAQVRASCKNDSDFLENAIGLFEIQHTYVRCHTLLRLGIREGLIVLSEPPLAPLYPDPMPWLVHQSLRLHHLAERRLLKQIFTVLDEVFEAVFNAEGASDDLHCLASTKIREHPLCPDFYKDRQRILALADVLSQRVQAFHANCQILGEVRASDPALAQARLGLNFAAQTVLRFLLQGLRVDAPVEL